MSSDDHISLPGFDREYKFEPQIPIGQTGKVLGENFEVIGCLKFSDGSDRFLLFGGSSYRWLSCERGHWTISRPVDDLFVSESNSLRYRGQNYVYDHSSRLNLVFAVGEFFGRVARTKFLKRAALFLRHSNFRSAHNFTSADI